MSQRQSARWNTWAHITTTGTTTIKVPPTSDYVYLCFGFVNNIGTTATGRLNIFSGSSTATLFSIDASALGNTNINFGELGAKVGSAGVGLYAAIAVTCDIHCMFTGYTDY